MSKIIDLFTEVDPFIEYIPKERTRSLVLLHFNISILSVLGFLAYAAFSTLLFLSTPEPSEYSNNVIYSNMTNEPIFQVIIGKYGNGFVCPNIPNYWLPTNDLTNKNTITKNIIFNSFISSGQNWDVYQFPIFGTIDAKYGTSYITLLNICSGANNDPGPIYLVISKNPTQLYNNNELFNENDPSLISYIIQPDVYQNSPPMINLEFNLKKTVSSNGNVKYDVSSNNVVKYVPSPFGKSSTDPYATNARQILLTINPTITVLTFKQKNIFTFIGSVVGIFPLFMLIGNKISGKIDGCMNKKNDKDIPMKEIDIEKAQLKEDGL